METHRPIANVSPLIISAGQSARTAFPLTPAPHPNLGSGCGWFPHPPL